MRDPPSGQIVTANNEIDRHWPKTMTRDWASPFRSMRIAQMLGTRTGLTQDDMRAMQLDVQSAEAEPVLAAVEAARKSPRFEKAEPDARLGIERLRLWDRKVDGRPVAALYEAFVRALWRRTFADEMDADVFQEFFEYGVAERYAGIDQIIDNPTSHWWNDIATVDRVETRDDIVLLAAADAVISLRGKFGDEGNWAWDRVHALSFRHALGAGGALLNWAFSRGPFPQTGDAWTVRKASVDVRQPYGVGDISSYRQVDRHRQLGRDLGRQPDRPVGQHDEPPLLRSERLVEKRWLPDVRVFAGGGRKGEGVPNAAHAVNLRVRWSFGGHPCRLT